ncbi:hypothetical protein PA7_18400 [Pseudonocardia asaccharolytica DSM 44247 = NBRC 16224]|uniref:DUF2537 domain-containing protein n=1 Tax=Pseudonocardia asaccharolytica DSM 44247 = NBRC 16224 TaxID=1123024 RepID=A0A511D0F0_9PSEU|nr:hypothetical protein PA7_18400 [Pseudonocardia asaccharolytica DSM 44247 = NBRC 16224]
MVFGEQRPDDPALPDDLVAALREWAEVAEAVELNGGPSERSLVYRRGRQLAARLADLIGRPVQFHDPVTGQVEPVWGRATGPPPRTDPERAAPTPWATGLAVSAFFAAFTALADIVLSRAFADAFGVLWAPANLLVAIGLAPSLWLLRRTPFWRWPAFGAAAGLVSAWVCLGLTPP